MVDFYRNVIYFLLRFLFKEFHFKVIIKNLNSLIHLFCMHSEAFEFEIKSLILSLGL